jgi:hypothetical protein
MNNECGAGGGVRSGRGNWSTQRKLCSPHILRDFTWIRNQAAAMVRRRLTTYTRPWRRVYLLTLHQLPSCWRITIWDVRLLEHTGVCWCPLSLTCWSRTRYISLLNKLQFKLSNPRLYSRRIGYWNINKGVTVPFEVEADGSYFRTVV